MTLQEWRYQHRDDDCWACGRPSYAYPPHEEHHITSGVHRKAGKEVLANLVRVCRDCHTGNESMHTGAWPIARQLALKKIHDPDTYDRVEVNLLRSRQPEAITEDEVDEWTRMMNR